MNFSKFDVSILVTMSLAVVIMSFTFPALGLTDGSNTVNESDVPQFNASANTFNFAGEFPEQPNTPTSGTLVYNASKYGDPDTNSANSIEGVSLTWIDRPQTTGAALEVQNISTSEPAEFVLTNFTSSSTQNQYRYDINSVGQTILIEEDGWTIEGTVVEISDPNTADAVVRVEWEIQNAPETTEGLFSSIPVVGNQLDAVANTLGYFSVVTTWFVATIVEVLINVLAIVFSILSYLFGMASWLASTYGAIVSSAPGWAGVVLTVPSILLFAEFAKLAVIGINMLPTT